MNFMHKNKKNNNDLLLTKLISIIFTQQRYILKHTVNILKSNNSNTFNNNFALIQLL